MKIFVLLSRFPYPLEKGDKLRAFHQIKELSKNNEIILCALSDKKVPPTAITILNKYCTHIYVFRLHKLKIYFNMIYQLIFTDKSLQVAYFYDKSIQKKINLLIKKHQPNHIYCQLIRVAEYVRNAKIKKTLDYMDALSRGMERRIEFSPFYFKWFFNTETTRLKRYEHFIFNDFDYLSIISEQDKKLIVNFKNDNIVVIPNGVDYSTYKFKNILKAYDLIFTGNMAYSPNIESVVYLVHQIMPMVWKKQPKVKLVIVGAEPDAKVVALKSDKVKVTGWVENISAYYAKSKVFIAPMQIGTGLQNKLLEAMAMKLPCITSKLANNALGATHQKNILIGNTPAEYATHIINLLNNIQLSKHISEEGYTFVTKNYTWEGTTAILENLINSTT